MLFFPTRLLAALLAAALPAIACAAEPSGIVRVADDGVTVHEAWARASAGAAMAGAAYVTLMGGSAADSLVGASTPVAATAEVHETKSVNGVMQMRPVAALPVPAGQMVTMAPGGYHVMLMGLKQPLAAGQSFPLTLTFQHAAPVTVQVQVRPIGGKAEPMTDHDHMKM